jgi:hypothetical protein
MTLKARVISVQDMITHAYFERVSVKPLEIEEFLGLFKPLLLEESVSSRDFLKEVFSKSSSEDALKRITRFFLLLEKAKEGLFKPKLDEIQDAMLIFNSLHYALCLQERQRAA